MILFIFLLFAEWQLHDLNFYEPLTRREVLLRPDGEIYVLYFADATIKQFSADGSVSKKIATKGQGPGELVYPDHMFFQGNQLFVHDLGNDSISVYMANGDFSHRLTLPTTRLVPVKTTSGWVTGAWRSQHAPDALSDLTISDLQFKNQRVIMRVAGRGEIGKFAVEGDQTEYTPVSPTPRMAVSPDGAIVALAEANDFRIHIIDANSAQVTHVIERREPKIPFDVEWAEIRLNEVKQMRPNHKYKINYPEYFPAIRSMSFSPEGWLEINRWIGSPHQNNHAIFLDLQGREIKRDLSWEQALRLVGYWKDWAYVLTFDSSREEAQILRCRRSEVKAFMQAHPDSDIEKTHRVFSR